MVYCYFFQKPSKLTGLFLNSDQNDPFNRSPLTIQEVIPATELKEKIEIWKASKRIK